MMKKIFQQILSKTGGAGGPGGAAGGGPKVPSPGSLISLGVGGVLIAGATYGVYNSLWTVEGGHRGVLFDRIYGVRDDVYSEGTHLKLPWFQTQTIFDIRSKPKEIHSPTGTKDLQIVDASLRVLYKPSERHLPEILRKVGPDYDKVVLPSLAHETLKSVLAQFTANELITKRETVSQRIRENLTERAKDFHILVDDVSITHIAFGHEYKQAIEAKQVAQQEAERAKFLVKQAEQDKQSTILRAQGEAKSAEMIGQAVEQNPGYIELRQLEAAKDIALQIAKTRNKVYLDSNSLLLNILQTQQTQSRLSSIAPEAHK